MPIGTPAGNLDIKNATLRTSNLETQNIKIGSIFVGTGNSLEETANVGNSMSNTIQFTNTHTAFTTTGNVSVGKDLTVTGNVTASTFSDGTAQLTGGTWSGSAASLTTAVDIGGVAFDGSASIVPTTFGAATFSGDVTVDTTTLHVDSTNNRVGVGTSSPIAALDIDGGPEDDTVPALSIRGGQYSESDLYVLNSYNNSTVGGVGYAAKVFGVNIKNKLETDNKIQIRSNTGGLTCGSAMYLGSDDAISGVFGVLTGDGAAGTTLTEKFTVRVNGNIGIGTTSPATKLHLYDTTNEPTIALQHLSGTENNASTNILGNLALHYSARSGGYPSVGIRSIRRAGTWDDQADMEFYVRNGGNGEQTAMVINSGAHLNSAKVGIGVTTPSTILQIGNTSDTTSDTYLTIASDGGNAYAQGIRFIHHGTDDSNMYGWRIRGDDTDDSFHINRIDAGNQQRDAFTLNASGMLILNQGSLPGASSNTHGIRMKNTNNGDYWNLFISDNNHFRFAYNGGARGYVDQNDPNGQMNFTGQHRTFIKDTPFTEAENLEGLIVSADQNKYIKMSGGIEAGSNAITMNETLPVVSVSVTAKDKKCFGVISASEDPETRTEQYGVFGSTFEKEKGDTRVYINSVGEGAIWVVNTNGLLESGDYITTSNVAGYGQKQDSEFLANYTVAKITMDCDFDPVTQPVQVIKKDEDGENILDEHGQIQWEDDPSGATEKAYKIRYLDADGNITDEANAVHTAAFVGCTYHCG